MPSSKRALVLSAAAAAAVYVAMKRSRRQKRRVKAHEDSSAKPGKRPRRPDGAKRMIKFLRKCVKKGDLRRNFVILVALAVIQTLVSHRHGKMQGRLFESLFLRKQSSFWRTFAASVLLAGSQSLLSATVKRCIERVSLSFRATIAARIHSSFFHDNSFYRLLLVEGMDAHPEDIVAADVPKFCDQLAAIWAHVIQATCDTAFYTTQLCLFAGPQYLGIMLGYVVLSATAVTAVAPDIGGLLAKLQALEGEYRYSHSRLADNAEAIALLGGEDIERRIVWDRYMALIRHKVKTLRTQWWFGMIRDFVLKYMGATVAVYLIIGPFFSGRLRAKDGSINAQARQLSHMRNHTNIVLSSFMGLGSLAISRRQIAQLSSSGNRIADFIDRAATPAAPKQTVSVESGDTIAFKDVDIVTPTGAILVKGVTFSVDKGRSLLITGPNGAGKSSLFRVLGGLWPAASGAIVKPGGGEVGLAHNVFYVPQRPYVSIGTLAEQLVYPLTLSSSDDQQAAEYRKALALVELEHLVERYPADKVVDWSKELSLGEQQRLGMARLFHHAPDYAILDECTSAVTNEMETRFYDTVTSMGITCVTISHRPALIRYHDTVFALDGSGGWTFRQVRHEEEDAAAKSWGQSTTVSRAMTQAPPLTQDVTNRWPDSWGGVWGGHHLKSFTVFQRTLRLLKIAVPSWFCKETTILTQLVGLVVMRLFPFDRIASLNGRTVQKLLERDQAAFIRLIGVSLIQSLLSAFSAPSLTYLTDRLALSCRTRWTTWILDSYFRGKAFAKAGQIGDLQELDERITKDVERVADDLASLFPSLIKPIVDVGWYTYTLYLLLGRRGILLLYGYITVGVTVLRIASPDMATLVSSGAARESAYRSAVARVRSHAESIAFFGGGDKELQGVQQRFASVVSHLRNERSVRWKYAAVEDFMTKQLPPAVAWVLSMAFVLEQPQDTNRGNLGHDLRYLASVVTHSFLAFGDILELFQRVVEIVGRMRRISELTEALNAAARPFEHTQTQGDGIEFQSVDVVAPEGRKLARSVTLRVAPNAHDNLLITGPNGAGKSSLFRVLGGLWPAASGAIVKPHDIFYVPQKPYACIGSLRSQIVYPLHVTSDSTDESVMAVLEMVHLGYLAEREKEGLDGVADWQATLSLGEQQRLGMARLFYHKPRFAILDECTNAISVDMEVRLYEIAIRLGICFVTITQRSGLASLHRKELKLTGQQGGWVLSALAEGAHV